MTLDIVIPTCNRSGLLSRALDSIAEARCPGDLEVTVIPVDNNSKDETATLIARYRQVYPHRLKYVFQAIQGRSAALNAGVEAGQSELVGMIDDDEEVDENWLEVIYDFFSNNPSYSFIGGPYRPRWSKQKPDWLAKEFGAIVGWVDGGDVSRQYGPGFTGMLMGGNAVVRRSVFQKIGLYDTALGRTANGLASCEDEDMFHRMLENGFTGLYAPNLVIYHYIPPERMTKSYHRRWSWGRGTSNGILAQKRKSGVAEFLGIPRWQIRNAIDGFTRVLKGAAGLEPAHSAFEGELRIWDLAGYINGRYFRKG